MKTKIIAAFPAGKTHFFNKNKKRCLDSDSSHFSWVKDEKGVNTKERNPLFPQSYIDHIKANMGKFDVIFVSSHDVVRDALVSANLKYTLVYPDMSQKAEYVKRYQDRGIPPALASIQLPKQFGSGSEIRNALYLYQIIQAPFARKKILSWLDVVRRVEGIPNDVLFTFRDRVMTTLDSNPKGVESAIN